MQLIESECSRMRPICACMSDERNFSSLSQGDFLFDNLIPEFLFMISEFVNNVK